MSYQLYADDECHECTAYVRPICHHDAWSCIICGLNEAAYQDIVWICYELHCQHRAHPRCYKKWCKQEKTVGCPQCGPRSYTEANQFCDYCNHFGHPTCIDV